MAATHLSAGLPAHDDATPRIRVRGVVHGAPDPTAESTGFSVGRVAGLESDSP